MRSEDDKMRSFIKELEERNKKAKRSQERYAEELVEDLYD